MISTRIISFVCICTLTLTPVLRADSTEHQRLIPLNTLDYPITIDGDLTDWGDLLAGGIAIDEHVHQLAGPLILGQPDAAVFKVAHDDQALYLAAHVVDASINTAEPYWTADCLELFLDVRPPGDGENHLGWHSYTAGAYQLMFAPPTPDNPKVRWMMGANGGPIGEIQVASKLVSDGYTLEIRIPLASINTTADRLKDPIGLDVAIDNVDLVAGHRTDRVQYGFGRSTSNSSDPSNLPRAQAGVKGVREGGRVIELAPVRFQLTPDEWNNQPRRTLRGDLLIKADDSKSSPPPIAVSLHYLGNPLTKTPADSDPITLRTETAANAYPGLGLIYYSITSTLDSVKTGQYEVITKLPKGPALVTNFQGVEWSADPRSSGTTAAHPNVDLPNITTDGQYRLFNGWKLSPAGIAIPLPGDMPVKMVWSVGGKSLLIQTTGFHDQGISVFDPAGKKITRTLSLDQTWPGMCLSPDGKTLFVSGGNMGTVLPFALPAMTALPPIKISAAITGKTWISGLAAPAAAEGIRSLCVLDEESDSLILSDESLEKLQRTLKTGYAPYAVALSQDGKSLAVSNWGDQSVSLFDRVTYQERRVAVGSHPNELVWSRNGRLFVACSGSNSVSVLQDGKVTETIKTCLDPSAPVGSTPIALAVSPDQSRLYVANADNNDVAVIDISNPKESRIMGLIPTGWYPSALIVSPDNKTLYVGVGKGMSFGPGAPGQYIGKLLNGAVEIIAIPNQTQLGVYTKQVIANTPVPERDMRLTAAQQAILKNTFPQIKHVLWIIRENRTYDQLLGDLPYGNGNPSLAMFGKDVTPNGHALAQEFTLFDNLYCSGEVSEDGHEWCNAAYATDFTEKAWISTYSKRGEPEADERLTSSPAGYLWDNCRRNNVTYRSYGEYANFHSNKNQAPVFVGMKGLEGHASLAWSDQYRKRDYERVDAFIDELRDAEKNNDWPAYMVMSLGEDHTHGGQIGAFTPNACVASNDLALGKIVDAVSHSKFWANTAIFVMEDDAQDGPDHVDAHRTAGFVISPYTRRHAIDSTLYTTVSFIHSMELILKLPPMTQYDSSATPVFNAMTEKADLTPFVHVEAHIDLAEKNPPVGLDAEASAKLDFTGYDRCDPATLNAILWHMFKPDVPLPAPVRSVHWLQSSHDPGT